MTNGFRSVSDILGSLMFSIYLFTLLLLAISATLIVIHRRKWLAVRDSATVLEPEKQFCLAQYRRRMRASGMIGVVGFSIGLGPLVPQRPGPYSVYVGILLFACLGLLLLASLDAWATRRHFQQLHVEQLAAQVQLAVELQTTSDSSRADSMQTTQP